MRELNITEIMDLVRKDRKTIVEKLRAANVSPIGKRSNAHVYDSVIAIRALYEKVGDEKKLKERELTAKTEKLELELEVMREKKIDVLEVERTVRDEYTIVRQRLIGLPAKLAKPLSFIEDPKAIQEMVMDNINECLEELRYDKQLEAKIAENQAKDSEAPTKA